MDIGPDPASRVGRHEIVVTTEAMSQLVPRSERRRVRMAAFEASGVTDTPTYRRFERQFIFILLLLAGFFIWAAFDTSKRVIAIFFAALIIFLLLIKLQMI